jgi:hypothetical protein
MLLITSGAKTRSWVQKQERNKNNLWNYITFQITHEKKYISYYSGTKTINQDFSYIKKHEMRA